MTQKTLDTLFYDGLKDIYFAERKILKGLAKMEKACHSDALKQAFHKHYDETEGQIERLEQVFDVIGKAPRGKTCDAILGILEEGEEIASDYKDSSALDAGLIASAQAVEHYEMARYGTLICWAEHLGLTEAARLLQQNLDEENKTDSDLTTLAESGPNLTAQRSRAA